MEKQRLDKFISNQMNMTRSAAKAVIRHKSVTVDGITNTNPATIIDADTATVLCDGNRVEYEKNTYILMNKPAGVLSASTDKSRKTVIDLVPDNLRRPGLFPVGRLDRDTTGLIIITDDGEFAHNMISPSKKIPKCYVAELDGEVTEDMVSEFYEGTVLADGTVCKPAILRPLGKSKAEITIIEGKYHQIKRMFGTVGLGVNSLHRRSVGNLELPDNMSAGDCNKMTKEQLNAVNTAKLV